MVVRWVWINSVIGIFDLVQEVSVGNKKSFFFSFLFFAFSVGVLYNSRRGSSPLLSIRGSSPLFKYVLYHSWGRTDNSKV